MSATFTLTDIVETAPEFSVSEPGIVRALQDEAPAAIFDALSEMASMGVDTPIGYEELSRRIGKQFKGVFGAWTRKRSSPKRPFHVGLAPDRSVVYWLDRAQWEALR